MAKTNKKNHKWHSVFGAIVYFTVLFEAILTSSPLYSDDALMTDLLQSGKPSLGAPIACSQTVGNPVNIVNGNKYQRESDLTGMPGYMPVEFVRHYNSRTNVRGSLGVGWRHNYQYALSKTKRGINILQGDGRLVRFYPTEEKEKDRKVYRGKYAKDGKLLVANNGYDWQQRDGSSFSFMKNGLLLEINRQGHSVHLHYDRDGRLLRAIDHQERGLRFSYDERDRLASLRDPAGREITYAYDENNNLAKITFPDETSRIYHYEDPYDSHNLTGITDERDIRYASWEYDKHDRAISTKHADGVGHLEIFYEQDKRLVTDNLGQVITYTISKVAGVPVISEVKGEGSKGCSANGVRYEYNESLQLISRTESDRHSRHYRYDERGRLIQIREQLLDPETDKGFSRIIAKYAYKGDDNWPSIITEPSVAADKSHQWWLRHNSLGQITDLMEIGYTPDHKGGYIEMGRVSRFKYANGYLIAADGPKPGDIDKVTYRYDSMGQLTQVQGTSRNKIKINSFDDYGRPSRVIDGKGRDIILEYDPRGRLIRLFELKEKAKHQLARMSYDGIGNITQLEGHRGVVEVDYDAAGRPVSIKMPDGKRKNWRWNTKDKLIADELLDREGRQLLFKQFEYDSAGRMTRSSRHEKEEFHYQYDVLGRLQKIIDPLGIETDYEYNPRGQMVAVFNITDGKRQLVERKHYNVHGLQDAQQDGRGNISRQQHDDFGRLLWRETPDGGVVMYRYNEFDNVAARVDESGVITRFDYDQQARLTGIGGFSRPATTRYYYRQDGKPEKVITPRQTVATDYLEDGRVSERSIIFKQLDKSFETGYRYDDRGRLVEKILPGGEKLVYAYQGEDRHPHRLSLKGWITDRPVFESVEWDERGRLKSLIKQADSKTSLEYDLRGRVQRIKSISEVHEYEYDQLSRLVGVASGGVSSRYGYDNLGRLSLAKIGKDEYRYAYDAAGNRTVMHHEAGKDVYRYAQDSNRLLRLNDVDFQYDTTGRLIQRGDLRYEYNAGGRLSAVYRADRLQATYAYNSEGERISKTDHTRSPSFTTYFLHENNRLVAEISEDGDIATQYIYLANRPVGVIQDEKVYMIATDWRLAPIDVVDSQGIVVWHAKYRPFGFAETDADPDKDGEDFVLNLRLPGQYYDQETGIAYNLHRDYDPALGRYLTSDPLGVSDGLNTYAYVESDPINRIDPTGLYGKDMHYYMTYFLATVAGLDQETVSVIAHGAQYIDDNPLTSPVLGGVSALKAYHFIMPRMDSPGNPLTSYLNPTAAQLDDLYRSAMVWDYACPTNRQHANLLKAQLYGEYLHAYADTYAHRDNENNPYGIWSTEGGYGHILDGGNPDKTYNFHTVLGDPLYSPTSEYWEYQEVRTLEAEKSMFYKLREDFRAEIEKTRIASGSSPSAYSDADYKGETERLWRKIAGDGNADIGEVGTPHYTAATGASSVLQEFNKDADKKSKIDKLNDWLTANGNTLSNKSSVKIVKYSKEDARVNRSTYLNGFTDGDLDGVLLPSPIPEIEFP